MYTSQAIPSYRGVEDIKSEPGESFEEVLMSENILYADSGSQVRWSDWRAPVRKAPGGWTSLDPGDNIKRRK